MSTVLSAAAQAALEPSEPDPLAEEETLLALFGDGEGALIPDEATRTDVIRELRTAAGELRAVFFSYAVLRDGGAPSASEGLAAEAEAAAAITATADELAALRGLPLSAWHQLCSDTGVDGLPEVEESFVAAAEGGDAQALLSEVQFLCAIVRLASHLANVQEGIQRSLYTLLYECVLPFARRDTSAGALTRVLGARSYLLPYLDEIRSSFSGFGARARARSRPLHDPCSSPPAPAIPDTSPSPSPVTCRHPCTRSPCPCPCPCVCACTRLADHRVCVCVIARVCCQV